MAPKRETSNVQIALPKGRMQEGVFKLLSDAGINVRLDSRGYRPTLSIPGFEAKVLKPQNIVEMLDLGSRDIGFAGADWVAELEADLVELIDTTLDPVKIVLAAPKSILEGGQLPQRKLVLASEYQRLAEKWIKDNKMDATFVRSYGATEVFPPDDADCIIDNTATGSTLRANNLDILATVMTSSTRLYASKQALDDPQRRETIEHFVLLIRSVLEARRRVMIELNVSSEQLEAVIEVLPCMREPTVAQLHGNAGYAVKAAIPSADLPLLIAKIKQYGGSDIIVSSLSQIIP